MPPPTAAIRHPFRLPSPIEVVVIGASTGGPNALARLLPSIPTDFSVPIVVVQHMPPEFTRHMAERLAARTKLDVREAVHGQKLHDAQVWIAPGDFHLLLAREFREYRLRTNQDAPENSCRPSVDVLFRSVAALMGAGTLGVVLTGMGQDGLAGAKCIREAGGQILVQDQETSVVWGMPGAIFKAGLADEVLPLDSMAAQIVRRVRRGLGASASGIHRMGADENAIPPLRSEFRTGRDSSRFRAAKDTESEPKE